jgi:hypothetical protein
MKVRASDLLDFPLALLDPEFGEWCFAVNKLWNSDPRLHDDFADVLLFLDFAFDVEKLIRSAAEN